LLVVVDVDGLNSWSFHMPISDQNLSSLFLDEFVDCASITCWGVPRRQPHRRSGLATLSSLGAIP